MENSKLTMKTIDKIDVLKNKLSHLNSMFDSLEMDDIMHNEIVSQAQSKDIGELLKQVLEQYKFELQGEKYYKMKKCVWVTCLWNSKGKYYLVIIFLFYWDLSAEYFFV